MDTDKYVEIVDRKIDDRDDDDGDDGGGGG